MQPKIHILSDETINQIAAGEVIESPASVVKELVENALDAKAKKITVELTGGGLKMIRVSDDGEGMHPEDARRCILPHATSKITRAQDLFHIATKGFRGEALSSIAWVSKMTLVTALEGDPGLKLEIEKGGIVQEARVARSRGTTVEVRSLFYSVPARKKFQKTESSISAEIFRLVTVLSLSHPEVVLELIANGRKAIKTQPLSGSFEKMLTTRATELLGEDFGSRCFPLFLEEGPLSFYGLLSEPTHTRNNKMGQYLFLNQRAMISPPIYEAIRLGYGTRLDEKRHPIFILHLNVPPDLIDINVHPQKLHVRLRKEEFFREKVAEVVEKALADKATSSFPKITAFSPSESFNEKSDEIAFHFEEEDSFKQQELALEQEETLFLFQFDRFLFFVVSNSKELMIIDSEAACFRLIFDDLISKRASAIEKQGLLVPFSIHLTSVESAMVLTHQEGIENLGFILRPIGKDVFLVEAIPSFIEERDVQQVIVDMAHALQELIGKIDYEEKRLSMLCFVAARHAKGKKKYSKEEAKHLYEELQKSKSPLHCPKGNPTRMVLNHEGIKDLFRTYQASSKGIKE